MIAINSANADSSRQRSKKFEIFGRAEEEKRETKW
jgi:hypothetical protein